ncbi:hypothetical protein ACLOJK_036730 [Asimina triloba]
MAFSSRAHLAVDRLCRCRPPCRCRRASTMPLSASLARRHHPPAPAASVRLLRPLSTARAAHVAAARIHRLHPCRPLPPATA